MRIYLLLITLAAAWTFVDGAHAQALESLPRQPASTVFGADEMLAALHTYLATRKDAYPASSLRLTHTQFPPAFSLPAGSLDVEVLPASPVLSQNNRFTLICRVNGRVEKNFIVGAKVEILTPVLTAARDIRRGEVLGTADVAVTTMDLGSLHGEPLLDADAVMGREARRAIRRGQALSQAMLAPAIVVRRGEMVEISARSGAMSAVAKGEALEDGAVGQTITVRNQTSKKKIPATVVSPGSVEVRF